MRIGELAQRVGLTTDAIRYYERLGLLAPARRTESRYRDYGPEASDDLEFIKKAQSLGLKLTEIREVLEIASGGQPPCDHVRTVIAAHLDDVELKLRELRALRSTLKTTLTRLDTTPQVSAGCRCAVIESV